MPAQLPISDEDRARRHVLSQRLYRLRHKYRFMRRHGLHHRADIVMAQIQELRTQYQALGGLPRHQGNVL